MNSIPIFDAPDDGWRAVPTANEIRWALAPLPAADVLATTDTYRHLALAAVHALRELHRDHRQLQATNVRLLTEFREARVSRLAAA